MLLLQNLEQARDVVAIVMALAENLAAYVVVGRKRHDMVAAVYGHRQCAQPYAVDQQLAARPRVEKPCGEPVAQLLQVTSHVKSIGPWSPAVKLVWKWVANSAETRWWIEAGKDG